MSRDLPVKPHFAVLCGLCLWVRVKVRVRIRVRAKKLKSRDNLKANDLVKASIFTCKLIVNRRKFSNGNF